MPAIPLFLLSFTHKGLQAPRLRYVNGTVHDTAKGGTFTTGSVDVVGVTVLLRVLLSRVNDAPVQVYGRRGHAVTPNGEADHGYVQRVHADHGCYVIRVRPSVFEDPLDGYDAHFVAHHPQGAERREAEKVSGLFRRQVQGDALPARSGSPIGLSIKRYLRLFEERTEISV